MKQVLIHRGSVLVDVVPAPLVGDGGVLVEVAYSLISAGTETSGLEESGRTPVQQSIEHPERAVAKVAQYLRQQGVRKTVARVRGQLESGPASGGSATGYSCAGVVIQVGKYITDVRPGDRVACGGGRANHAELVMVPRNLLVKVPDGCDQRYAASATLGAIAMQGVRRADLRLGEMVAVIGLGLVGQITAQLLKVAGCRVVGIDLDRRRVDLARQLGVDHALVANEVDLPVAVRHLTEGHGVDATIIAAAARTDAIVQQAMEITRKKGRVVLVGDVGLGLRRSPFYEKEIDFLISCSYGPGRYDPGYEEEGLDYPYAYVRWTENRNMQEYLRLVARGRLQLGPILEREYDVTDAPRAYEELRTGSERPLGVLLRYPVAEHPDAVGKRSTKVVLQSRPVTGRIKVAVVGAGGFALGTHLPNLQRLADLYQIRAVVSGTGSNAKSVAQQFSADYASTCLEDVLNDQEVDAVLICTRHHLHAQQTVAALKAGKHVLVEKPLALSEQEIDSVLDCYGSSLAELASGQSQLSTPNLQPVLAVGFNRRFSPAARRARELLAGRQSPLMIFYRVNAGYMPREHWVHGREGGGRALGDGCHMLDLCQYFVGAALATSATATPIVPQVSHISATDNMVVTITYADGSVATVVYTSLGAKSPNKEYVEIYADGQVLVIDDFRSLVVHGSTAKGWVGAQQDKGHLEELHILPALCGERAARLYRLPSWQRLPE